MQKGSEHMIFEKPGADNTQAVVELALQTARERGIRDIVVSTSKGDSAAYFDGKLGDIRLTCVTLAYGFRKVNGNPMTDERRAELLAKGYQVVTGSHSLSGGERSLSRKYGGISPVEVIADTLRMFSQGTKVCVEIAAMAADAGCIKTGEPVICLGGTGMGLDTALILKPANTGSILDTRIDEILCKPVLAAPEPVPYRPRG